MKKVILFLVLAIQLFWLGSCQNNTKDQNSLRRINSLSGTFHVSKEGADSNPGTKRSPFLTLAKAAEILESGDICIVHSGTYRECFTPKNNGTSDKPILLIAAEGEKVIISGMETMNDWEEAGNGIFKAQATWDLGESNFVLINGKMGFEARFPNKTNDDPLDIEGGTIIEEGVSKLAEGEDLPSPVRFISETSLPVQWTTRDLSEAKVWVLAHRKWSAWTAPVTGYDPKEQLIWFKEFPENQISSNYNPNWLQENYGRSKYYIFGSKVLLDIPDEWYFDRKTKGLHVMVSGQKKPTKGQVEFRKREVAVDLRDKEFWEISGFEIEGATIDMSNAENCTLNDCIISNFWQSVPAQSARAMTAQSSGITIGGKNNTIKNSEISYSAGAGITLSGQNNIVANNLIHHTNYLGSIATGAMRVSGFNNQIIYNTVHTTGRDIIKLNGAGSVIAWNHLYNPGLICYDLGILYSGGQDYRNTLIHHNLVHNDHYDHHPCNGIYFDNYTNNGIVHHNIIWGNIRTGVRLNRPGNYHQVFNNTTVSIDNRYGPWEGPAVQFGSSIVNNYSIRSIVANEEVFQTNNAQGFPYDTLKLLPQVTEPSKGFDNFGFLDYIGAISNNSENWTVMVGHDFDRSSIPPVDRDLPFMRNYINNGSFDWGRDRDGNLSENTLEEFWEMSGAVELSYSPGFHHPAPSIRKSVHANSLLLKSKDPGISQTVKGLQPDTQYKVGVYVRPYENADAIMSVQSSGVTKEVSSKEVATIEGWKLLVLAFRAGPEDTEVRVRIGKTGEGDVYLDNIGLVPDLAVAETESAQKEPAKLIYTGRLAVSHDGNIHDEDDWGALAFVWGIVASFGIQEKLVHVDHSDHLVDNTPNGEKQMILSAEGWKYFPGFDSSIVFNAWRDLNGAIANFKKQAEAGSATDILSFMCAGPMEVPWQCINAVTPSKRKFIRVISHAGWNDNHTWKNADGSESHTWSDMKRSFESDGVIFEKIPVQNGLLGPNDNDWSFLNNMPDNTCIPASAWRWMLSREQKHSDVSDCGMTWYCLTDDVGGTGAKFEARFKNPIDPTTDAR